MPLWDEAKDVAKAVDSAARVLMEYNEGFETFGNITEKILSALATYCGSQED